MNWPTILRSALVSGGCASLGSTAALALAARREGKGAAQPLNATAHWRFGNGVARQTAVDGRTVLGYATNHAASVFWAVFFEAWVAWRRPKGALPLLRDAAVMSAVAAAVDYGATPKRFTPGWELVLTRKGMAIAYAGLALGLATGVALTDRRR